MPAWHAAELALFFFFSAFNLTWFVFRNACIAVDEYVYFETLESCRRVGHIGLMLIMLFGLPFSAFLILINLTWAILIVLAGKRLIKRKVITPQFSGNFSRLRGFLRENWASARRTATQAAAETYLHSVLYLAVPLTFGLGAPTIVLDTTLKIFFGTLNLCAQTDQSLFGAGPAGADSGNAAGHGTLRFSCARGRRAAADLVANARRAFYPEPYIDRVGRLRGNLIGLCDILTGRWRPERAAEL